MIASSQDLVNIFKTRGIIVKSCNGPTETPQIQRNFQEDTRPETQVRMHNGPA
jgi:hypothetical protein